METTILSIVNYFYQLKDGWFNLFYCQSIMGYVFFLAKFWHFWQKIGIIIILGANLTNFAYFQGKIYNIKNGKKNYTQRICGPIL
jgi:hypothetical protein